MDSGFILTTFEIRTGVSIIGVSQVLRSAMRNGFIVDPVSADWVGPVFAGREMCILFQCVAICLDVGVSLFATEFQIPYTVTLFVTEDGMVCEKGEVFELFFFCYYKHMIRRLSFRMFLRVKMLLSRTTCCGWW